MEQKTLEVGTKIFTIKEELKFNTDLINEFSVFQDNEGYVLGISREGYLAMLDKKIIYLTMEEAKTAYLGWLAAVITKLEEAWSTENV